MAIRGRLTVGDIQIYFDGDVARYTCPRRLELSAVEEELESWRAFVERWLEAAEPPKPRAPTGEEAELLAVLKNTAQGLKRSKRFQKNQIALMLEGIVASPVLGDRWPGLSKEQKEELVNQIISTL